MTEVMFIQILFDVHVQVLSSVMEELKIHAAIFIQPNGVVHQEVQSYRDSTCRNVCACVEC